MLLLISFMHRLFKAVGSLKMFLLTNILLLMISVLYYTKRRSVLYLTMWRQQPITISVIYDLTLPYPWPDIIIFSNYISRIIQPDFFLWFTYEPHINPKLDTSTYINKFISFLRHLFIFWASAHWDYEAILYSWKELEQS